MKRYSRTGSPRAHGWTCGEYMTLDGVTYENACWLGRKRYGRRS